MMQRTFLSVLSLCAVVVLASHAEVSTAWLPVRILGMVYPLEAKFARIEGIVRAKCLIREDGSIADVAILSGHPVLARSVKANILQWTFRRADGEKKPGGEAIVTYSFQLKGSCDNHKGCKEEFWFEYPGQVTVVSELPRVNTGNRKGGSVPNLGKGSIPKSG